MPEPDYEYRTAAHYDPERVPGGPASGFTEGCTPTTADPALAGRDFRDVRRQLGEWGGHAELQRRAVGPWETIERADAPPPAVAPSS